MIWSASLLNMRKEGMEMSEPLPSSAQNGFCGLTRCRLAAASFHACLVGTQTRVVGENHAGGARALRVADLLDKGTRAAVHHENVWRRPRIAGVFTLGIAPSRVHIGVAKVGIGVVHHLRNRKTVLRNSKQSHAVIVAFCLEETVGNLHDKPQAFEERQEGTKERSTR